MSRTVAFLDPTTNSSTRTEAFRAMHSDDVHRNAMASFGDDYGVLTFAGENLRRRLGPRALEQLERTIQHGEPLNEDIADEVATAMKDWAIEQGCTHYCHWFQPLTGSTAEKHDSFINLDHNGQPLAEFSGEALICGEPDASSFPSGGVRDTWEARGYTAWDPTSPAFIMPNGGERTLCIPTAFVSWTGESLDLKTPLMRSNDAISRQAMRILRLFGNDTGVRCVYTTLGCEQEYFLIDEDLASMRPDLAMCGRTVMGAQPPKGHQLDDHYFGAIPSEVQAFMGDVEERLYELGIPAKTRHNEVAPRQFEIAPLFERSNVASDHQQLMMTVLKRAAHRHGFTCLLHEKPFAGINGTGKHNNWAMCTNTGHNLLSPGKGGEGNLQFLTFVCAVVRALDLHAGILRGSVASAGNDHRLGANEAPPAILSIYTGEELGNVLDTLMAGETAGFESKSELDLGATVMPTLERHPGDRNRTSPFAFIGNRFEFRAVGGQAPVAWPNTVLNTAVAQSIDWLATKIEAALADGPTKGSLEASAVAVLGEVLNTHGRVIFNGDNYSDAWHEEAAQRGLPVLRGTADALPTLRGDEVAEMFSQYGVMNHRELTARIDVLMEQYITTLTIEASTMAQMVDRLVRPAAVRYCTELAESVATMKSAGVSCDGVTADLSRLTSAVDALVAGQAALQAAIDHEDSCVDDHARFIQGTMIPAMDAVRDACDEIECVVPADLWPMPTYTDMLFG
ncbi:MAG: glutamine synthetase III [Phycisphaerales bacterium]|nr:glutamine synthetase III [Phycisphaerales bacterium]